MSAWAVRTTSGILAGRSVGKQFAPDLPAVKPRQEDVQQNQVRLVRACKFESSPSVGSLKDVDPGQFEVDSDDEP
jgi:hypothetical protein